MTIELTQLNKFIVHLLHDKFVEDLLPKFLDAKVFSIVDACSSFFMMLLSKCSNYLTPFATMYGRFRYLCVPMGAVSHLIALNIRWMRFLVPSDSAAALLMI